MSESTGYRRPRAISRAMLLGLILLAGLTLRVWYGSWGLYLHRFEDEKYSWANVQSILDTGTLEPVKSYYPYPLFNLPPAGLLITYQSLGRWWTDDRSFSVRREGTVSPAAVFLCRVWGMIYGTAALAFTFLIGRRLFSPGAGLIGALLLAFSPWGIHSSGYFKPDALLLFTTLLAFYLSLRAVERPTVQRYLLAGLGIGLALSSKMTGGVVAVPLLVATLITGRKRPRDFALLALAGISSALLFIFMNPYWTYYLSWLNGLRRDYAMRADWAGMTHAEIPLRVAKFVVGRSVQEPWLGALGLVGLALLAVTLVRRRSGGSKRLERGMMLSFPVVYTAVYSLQTPYFKPNNFLPLLPYVFLTAGWVLCEAWRWGGGRWRALQRPAVAIVAGLALVLVAAPAGSLYTYRSLTPSTRDLALQNLSGRLEPRQGRLVYAETWNEPWPPWEGQARRFANGEAGLRQVERLDALGEESLDLADGLVFYASRVREPGGEAWIRRVARFRQQQARFFGPRPFAVRGPEIIAIHQPFVRSQPPRRLEVLRCAGRRDCVTAELPSDVRPGELISLTADVSKALIERLEGKPRVRLGRRPVDLVWASWRPRSRSHHMISARLGAGEPSERLWVSGGGREVRPEEVHLELYRWKAAERSR